MRIKSIFTNLCQITSSLSIFCLAAAKGATQVVPDTTLPINSTVTPDGNNTFTINGGTTAGNNLFHSFEQFSLSGGKTAQFNNATDIQNIITRVTGNSISNIDGILKTNGTANLFLINPNGIVFGANARLNIGGSFFASTAESLHFADGTQFSARNPQSSSVLTVNVPVGLQYGASPGSIVNQSRAMDMDKIAGLQVLTGKTLGLIGGGVALEGGHLSASQGRIELGSVGDNSFVSLTPIEAGFVLGYERVPYFQDINLSQQASVDASGKGGGTIQVRGNQVTLTQGAKIVSDTNGSIDGGDILIGAEQFQLKDGAFVGAATSDRGAGGNITVRTSKSVQMSGSGIEALQQTLQIGILTGKFSLSDRQIGGLFSETAGSGRAGNIAIDTSKLVLQDGAVVATNSLSKGAGGNLQIKASNLVQLTRSGFFTGSIIPGVPLLNPNDRKVTGLSNIGKSAGDGGKITIDTGRLILSDEAIISAATLTDGAAGDIVVRAFDSVQVLDDGKYSFAPTEINSLTVGGAGVGGNITINTGTLIASGGGLIAANSGAPTPSGEYVAFGGRGGDVTVTASKLVEFRSSADPGKLPSGLNSRTFTAAPAGKIKILTGRLIIQDGAQVSTSTSNQGNGGTVDVKAESVELYGSSLKSQSETGLFSSSEPFIKDSNQSVTGLAGDLTLETYKLIVQDGAAIEAKSSGSGAGGNINLHVRDILLMRRGSQISTTAGTQKSGGNGGNITINAPSGFIVAVPSENSDISANAFTGSGGTVDIKANGIYGIQFRKSSTPLSDITASSEFGTQGTVELNTPGIDPNSGLVELLTVPVYTQIAQGCYSSGYTQNSFVITGRGGLPSNPREAFSNDTVQPEWAILVSSSNNRQPQAATKDSLISMPAPIVEATGWVTNSKGDIILTTNPHSATPHSSGQPSTACGVSTSAHVH